MNLHIQCSHSNNAVLRPICSRLSTSFQTSITDHLAKTTHHLVWPHSTVDGKYFTVQSSEGSESDNYAVSAYLMNYEEALTGVVDLPYDTGPPELVLGANRLTRSNYFHFVQSLIALHFAAKEHPDLPVLLPEFRFPYESEWLSLINIGQQSVFHLPSTKKIRTSLFATFHV